MNLSTLKSLIEKLADDGFTSAQEKLIAPALAMAFMIYTANGMKLVNQSRDRKVVTTNAPPQPSVCSSNWIR